MKPIHAAFLGFGFLVAVIFVCDALGTPKEATPWITANVGLITGYLAGRRAYVKIDQQHREP